MIQIGGQKLFTIFQYKHYKQVILALSTDMAEVSAGCLKTTQ